MPEAEITIDMRLLIVGQGLAGSHLSLEAIRRGHQVTVVDLHRGASSSRISAGLLNPAAGRRFTLQRETWQQWQTALAIYRYWEQQWSLPLLDPRRMWRPFQDEKERFHFHKRLSYPPARQIMRESTDFFPDWLPPSWKGRATAVIDPVYLLNVPLFLDRTRLEIQKQGQLIEEWFDWDTLVPGPLNAQWKGKIYDKVFLCEGASLLHNPWFRWVPFQTSKGSILDFPRSPFRLPPDWILNCKHWLFQDHQGKARLGATASPPSSQPPQMHPPQQVSNADSALIPLLQSYDNEWNQLSGHEIVHTGYRPRLPDNQPLVGLHPALPSLGVLNGTGGRGGILTPWLAMRLFAWMDHQLPLPPQVDCRRNFPVSTASPFD